MKSILKRNIKTILNLSTYFLVIISVVFLVRYLLNNKLLYIPSKINWQYMIISIIFLIIGFFFSCKSWQIILKKNNIFITYREAVLSRGISTLGKYIPGKVWLILGASGRVASTTGESVTNITYVSILEQIMSIVAALMVGIISLYNKISSIYILLFYIISILCISLILIFKNEILLLFGFKKNNFFKKLLNPFLSSLSFFLFSCMLITWLSWSIGFFFMARSIVPNLYSPIIGCSFSLAAVLGILVVIAPGGLGVREGALAFLLAGFVNNKQDIATIAAISRLWFLIGEIFIFLTALILLIFDKIKRKNL